MNATPLILGTLALVGAGSAAAQAAARTRDEASGAEQFMPNIGPTTLDGFAAELAVANGCDPRLMLATIDTENGNWDVQAVNNGPGDAGRGGAWGLCQLTLQTARDVDDQNGREWAGVDGARPGESLLNAPLNVTLAAHLLRELSARAVAAGFVVNTEPHAANVASLYNSGKLLRNAPASTRDVHVPRFLRNWTRRGGVA